MEKLVIIEDNADIARQLRWGFSKDYEVLTAEDADSALALFDVNSVKVATLDLGLPPHADSVEEGFRCIEGILSRNPFVKIIVTTGNEGREHARKALEMGAYDYYQKPVDLNDLRVIIRRAFHLYDLEEENRQLHSRIVQGTSEMGNMIGQCPKMQEVFSVIRKVASTDVTCLIQGESGTGKELVARAIHTMSLRKDKPFVAINCGAIPETLLEAELFGHEKGAFTGAHAQVQGKVEYANRGVLFLDEIAELSLALQVKLLRFLQEKVIQRVGGREDISIDARILAATNNDIMGAMKTGRFREDLYYRLGVVTISLPALRDRGDDLIVLANFFLSKFSQAIKKKTKGLSPSALESIISYSWPGNVRELENRIQRAVIMSDSKLISPRDLGFSDVEYPFSESDSRVVSLREARDKAEKETILRALSRNHFNIARSAEELAISRPTLYDLLKRHNISHTQVN